MAIYKISFVICLEILIIANVFYVEAPGFLFR